MSCPKCGSLNLEWNEPTPNTNEMFALCLDCGEQGISERCERDNKDE